MELTERYRKIYLALDEFYTTMKGLEKISNTEEREGKQVTKMIMTTNDIEIIFNEEREQHETVKEKSLRKLDLLFATKSEEEIIKMLDKFSDADYSASPTLNEYLKKQQ